MLGAITLQDIYGHLAGIDLEKWGPGGDRFVCILFWNYEGYRHLENSFDVSDWEKWSRSSGEFWDLFLAGCFTRSSPRRLSRAHGSRHQYGLGQAKSLARDESKYFCWNEAQAARLAQQVADLADKNARTAHLTHIFRPWTFTGPIDLVAVRAVRNRDRTIIIDWASLRGGLIRSRDLPEAIGSYTEAHIDDDDTLKPEDILGGFPIPGSFEDMETPEIERLLLRHIPGLGKIILKGCGVNRFRLIAVQSAHGVHPRANPPRLSTSAAHPAPTPHGGAPPRASTHCRWSRDLSCGKARRTDMQLTFYRSSCPSPLELTARPVVRKPCLLAIAPVRGGYTPTGRKRSLTAITDPSQSVRNMGF